MAESKTVFTNSNGNWRIQPRPNPNFSESLPPGNYTIHLTKEGPLLVETPAFSLPSRFYGNIPRLASRILNTFKLRSQSTGCLFLGEKGSGKSLLAKLIATVGVKQDMPCLILNQALPTDLIALILQNITQPCTILLDEFEKTWPKENQNEILTVLDGLYSSRKLFLFTANNRFAINEHLINRPGRIFYNLLFSGLDKDAIREYCETNLKDKTQTDSVCECSNIFEHFNFDMLKALVEEMNRYNEPASTCLDFLNIQAPVGGLNTYYKVSVTNLKGDPVYKLGSEPCVHDEILTEDTEVVIVPKDGKPSNTSSWEWMEQKSRKITIKPSHLSKADGPNGTYIFTIPDEDLIVTYTKSRHKTKSIKDYLTSVEKTASLITTAA